jgi:hypothetical protein
MKLKILGVALGACLSVLTLSAGAPTDYVSVSPTALKPMMIGMAALPFYTDDNEFYFTSETSNYEDALMYAPLNLHQGAQLKRLSIYFTRNTDDGDICITVFLTRQKLSTGATQNMGAIYTSSSAASASRKVLSDVTIAYGTIDNNTYTYALMVGFSRPVKSLKFHGAKMSLAD